MSKLTPIPTVEQINLEHRLANSKASEAIQHATNCGLMLLQVKASLNHGEWLPWLKQQQESGAIGFSQQTASKYMKLAANYNHERNLSEAPSIRAGLFGLLLFNVLRRFASRSARSRSCHASDWRIRFPTARATKKLLGG